MVILNIYHVFFFHHYLGKYLFLCGSQVVSKENLTPKRPFPKKKKQKHESTRQILVKSEAISSRYNQQSGGLLILELWKCEKKHWSLTVEDHPMNCMWFINMVIVSFLRIGLV